MLVLIDCGGGYEPLAYRVKEVPHYFLKSNLAPSSCAFFRSLSPYQGSGDDFTQKGGANAASMPPASHVPE